MKRALPFIAAVCLVVGCQRSAPFYESHAARVSASKEQLYTHFDEEVIITGTAQVAPREGVVLVMDDGTRVMIPELREWPRRAAGKTVTVMGMLERVPTAMLAASSDAPKPDDRFLLKGVRWKVGPAATTKPS